MMRNEALKALLNHKEDNYGLLKFNLNVIRKKLALAKLTEDQLIKLKMICNDLLFDIEKRKREFVPQVEAPHVKIQNRS